MSEYEGPPRFEGADLEPCQCTWTKPNGIWHMAQHGADCAWHNPGGCCPGEHGGTAVYRAPLAMHSDDCRTQRWKRWVRPGADAASR